jgi:hypothetical protein
MPPALIELCEEANRLFREIEELVHDPDHFSYDDYVDLQDRIDGWAFDCRLRGLNCPSSTVNRNAVIVV